MTRRILHVIPSVGPLRGGPSVMVRGLAASLVRHGVETHVVTTNDNGAGLLDVPCGMPVNEGGVTYWYFERQSRFYTFSWPLTTWLKQHVGAFSAVHIHALFSYAMLPAAYWARRHGVPYVVRPLGTLNRWGIANRRPALKELSIRILESRVLGYSAAVHFTSEQERIEAQELDLPVFNAAVIPNPVSMGDYADRGNFRTRYPQVGNSRLVLFLSRLDEKKGLDLLFQAFSRLRSDEGVWLVVAGEGPSTFVRALKEDAERLGIANRILWTGFLSGTAKAEAFADADVFVLSSYSENFGISVAEAMASGVPVIVTDQVAVHTDVSAAGAGLVVPCDADALAGALDQLLGNRDQRLVMGDNGQRLAADRYSSDAVTRQLIQLYDQIAA
jgi:glycosyltransferase involved in cell wall biosynthesis